MGGTKDLVKHVLGTYANNSIEELKEILGVTQLEIVLIDSMEELYSYAPFLRDEEVRPAEPEVPPL